MRIRPRTIVAIGLVVVAAATLVIIRLTSWSDPALAWPASLPPCDGFDFPVGPPDAAGYFDAQPFRTHDHLGGDWRRIGADDTQIGDPVYAASTGVVIQAIDIGGDWGNVVRVAHGCGVESVYAHLDAIAVAAGTTVKRGHKIGTIGMAADDTAHLHFELRDRPLPLGGGYGDDTTGYLDPTAYIRAHRPH